MRLSSALPLLLLVSGVNAFTTPTFLVGPSLLSSSSSWQRRDTLSRPSSTFSSSSSALFLKRSDIIKKRQDDDMFQLDESKYVQTMTPDERRENIEVMRQIFKSDLADLQRRRDYTGWVEARKDLRSREEKDPWFELNEKLREAVQLDEEELAAKIKELIEKVGGPPPGVEHIGEYAKVTEIYDTPMSLSRAETIAAADQRQKSHERWKSLVAQRKANEIAAEEERINNPYKEEEESKIRRERMLKRLYGEIEAKRKQAEAKAKEIQARYDKGKGSEMENLTPLERALAQAKKDAKEKSEARKRKRLDAASDKSTEPTAEKQAPSSSSSSSASPPATTTDAGGRPRLPGDVDVTRGEIMVEIADSSDISTDDLRVRVTSDYSASQSDPPMRKHCFQYTIKITNQSETETVQLLSRRFEIQTVGARQKDVVQGQGVTGRQPILNPGETFEYTSTAPLSVRPIGTTIIAARMKGTYSYSVVDDNVKEEDRPQMEAELGTFHFVFPVDQRVKPVAYDDEDDDEDEDDEDEDDDDEPVVPSSSRAPAASAPQSSATASSTLNPPTTLPGDEDMITGDVPIGTVDDNSETVSDDVRVAVTSQYREERSDDKLQKHCFAYNIRITNERATSIQLVSRRFEIQTVGSPKKDVIQGPGVTGRQPILKPGESFEYTSTAPLSVKPMGKTPVVARMSGEYSFVVLGNDGKSPISSEALKAKLGVFHFVLPQVA